MSIITHKLEEYNTIESINDLVSKINEKLPKRNDCKIYPNQMRCAIKGIKMFDSNLPRPNHLVVQGKTQSGKTGVLTSMIMLIDELKIEGAMSVNTIYYITGDNGCKLIKQTQERISHCFTADGIECKFKCLKNSDLKNDINNEQVLTNTIIFIDESHYGVSSEKNILIKWLESKGINMHNDKELVEKSVYIVSNSATPYGEINSDCGKYKSYVALETDDWNGEYGYVGFKEYNEKNCFVTINCQINKTNAEEMCEQLKIRLDEIFANTGKVKCGIIRMRKESFKKCQDVLEKYFHVETYFSTNENINYSDIQWKMEHEYEDWDKPLIFVVAGAYRMGVSIPPTCKKNIGFIFDYSTGNAKNSVITTEQGLLGRVTGYWETDDWCDITIYINEKHYNGLKACYVEQAISTPMADVKQKFVPKEEGTKVGIISDDDFIEIFCDEKFGDKEYNHKVKEFVEASLRKMGKPLPEDIVWLPGRRNDKRNKVRFSQPTFSLKEDGARSILSKKENINKQCYTTLYDIDENTIKVRYGKIVKGDYVETYDENKKIIRTLTT